MRTALLRLPFLLLAAAGLWLAAQGAAIPAKAWLAQILLDRAFAQTMATGSAARPWPWADSVPVARIAIRRLGVERIVLSGGSGEAMAFGPTLMPGAAAPGDRGTAVFAAHRDTHFAFLARVVPGDEIIVEQPGRPAAAYVVTGAEVVSRDGYAIDRYAAVPRIALATCWPFGATSPGPLRYVVTAEQRRPARSLQPAK